MSVLRFAVVLVLLLGPALASAEALVLLQGYLGTSDNWRRSGVTTALLEAGWSNGGQLVNTPRGIEQRGAAVKGGRRFYTLAFDTEAPLLVQARQLEPYMRYLLERHAGETLYLVGHSAGGVLARLYLVQHPRLPVSALITFSSPHLGTASAEAGLQLWQGPLGLLTPFFDEQGLAGSQGLYQDLSREQPGTLLFWLNRQPHPYTRYISVVHQGGGPLGLGDLFVPPWSQDMNNVLMLRGRAQTYTVPGGHELNAADAAVLVELLRRLQLS